VPWTVVFHPEFYPEYEILSEVVQNDLDVSLIAIQELGPRLGRPRVDTLNGSRHANMKELRFNEADGVWRFAFAFDPDRHAVVLCGGDKSGGNQRRFYQRLIAKADSRFDAHLASLKAKT